MLITRRPNHTCEKTHIRKPTPTGSPARRPNLAPGRCCCLVLLAYVATQGQMLYGMALLFTYAIGHCLLMLLAGTFTGFIEAFAQSRGGADVSNWSRRLGGALVALVGGYLVWNV